MPRYPIRFLLAVPIEYVGGNGVVLGLCLAIIACGHARSRKHRTLAVATIRCPTENLVFLTWAAVPPF